MISRPIPLPNLFWQSDLKVPPRYAGSGDEYLQETIGSFTSYWTQIHEQEENGIVNRTDVINLILSAWSLQHMRWKWAGKNPDLLKLVTATRDIAKKYGFTKLYDAAYHETMISRLEQKFSGDFSDAGKVSCCGRCGRAIWNPISLQYGKGPVCRHKGVAA